MNPKRERAEPLPWQHPKPPEEDRAAPERIRAILESPSYRRPDEDPDFLRSNETRGVRLQIDYLKPELVLEQHGVAHTIVVFGGTRITEPAAAAQRVAELEAAQRDRPDDANLRVRLERARRIQAKSHYYDVARDLGRLVTDSTDGQRTSLVMMTGGGPGIMEAVNRGVHDRSGRSVGLNIDLPHEQYPNPYVTPELCFRFHYFALRKLHFLLRARALVAFPGGYGTLDEVFETLTLIQTRKIDAIPVVLVGEDYWRRVVDVDFLLDEGVIDPEDRDLFWFAEDATSIWRSIVAWYERAGTPLFSGGGP